MVAENTLRDQLSIAKEARVNGAEAAKILGRDFIGIAALSHVSELLTIQNGRHVELVVENAPVVPYTQVDLSLARDNGEALILRPSHVIVGSESRPITLQLLRQLADHDPLNPSKTLFGTDEPSTSDGAPWYVDEAWYKNPISHSPSWIMVTKNPLPGTVSQTWDEQYAAMVAYKAKLVESGANHTNVHIRRPDQAVLDAFLYYLSTGKPLLDYREDRVVDNRSLEMAHLGVVRGEIRLDHLSHDARSEANVGICPAR